MRVRLDCHLPPEHVLLAFREEPWPFVLTGRWVGGGAIVGSAPLRTLQPGEDPFERIEDLPAAMGDAEVGGGWFGWLGYGLGARVEVLPPRPPRPVALPDAHLAYYDDVLRLDAAGAWWFESLATPDRAAHRLEEVRGRLAAAMVTGVEARTAAPVGAAPDRAAHPPAFVLHGADGHVAAVRECTERIAAGEIFQANLCVRLEAAWDGDLADLFARAAPVLQPAYGACFLTPWGGVASFSPELFLRRRGREVTTGPIKGTVAREEDPATLERSAKDRAEHVMIVDLMRNDLGRVSEYGSIQAPSVPETQAHPGVWHLVSEVRGRLDARAGDAALLRATFPPGSVTGAPKVQAMRVISELETTGREIYTGAIGFASPHAGLELNVAIRSFEARAGRLWLGAGGGIVADSDPEAELEECLVKARPLISAVGGSLAAPARGGSARRAPAPAALGPDRRRPDPALGVFETLRVRDGAPEHLEAHLHRLRASLETLYEIQPPRDIEARVHAAAVGDGALRIDVVPGQPVTLTVRPASSRALPIVLRPFTLPGGLGAHKWRDRRLVDALSRDGTTPLLLDSDGTVLEAAWASVLVRRDGRLLTPRADGRILPGTSLPDAEPADLTLDDLRGEVFVTSSLAGVVPAVLA